MIKGVGGSPDQLLASLLLFRVIYYLVPFVLALALLGAHEAVAPLALAERGDGDDATSRRRLNRAAPSRRARTYGRRARFEPTTCSSQIRAPLRRQADRRHARARDSRRRRGARDLRQCARARTAAGSAGRRTARAGAALARRARRHPPRDSGGEAETALWSERAPIERLFQVDVAPLATDAGDVVASAVDAARSHRSARASSACAPTSSPTPATNCARRSPRCSASSRRCRARRRPTRARAEIPRHHARAGPAHGAADRRSAVAVAHRAEAARAPGGGGRSGADRPPRRRHARAAGRATWASRSSSTPMSRVIVTGERDELVRVAENLIENAIKYGAAPTETGAAAVEVTVGTQRQGRLSCRARLRPRHRARTSAASDGTLLSRRSRAEPRQERHRARARDRQTHLGPPSRPADDLQPARPGIDVHRFRAACARRRRDLRRLCLARLAATDELATAGPASRDSLRCSILHKFDKLCTDRCHSMSSVSDLHIEHVSEASIRPRSRRRSAAHRATCRARRASTSLTKGVHVLRDL